MHLFKILPTRLTLSGLKKLVLYKFGKFLFKNGEYCALASCFLCPVVFDGKTNAHDRWQC